MANNGSHLSVSLVIKTYVSIIGHTLPDDFAAVIVVAHGPSGAFAVESIGLEPDTARAVVAEALRFMRHEEPEVMP